MMTDYKEPAFLLHKPCEKPKQLSIFQYKRNGCLALDHLFPVFFYVHFPDMDFLFLSGFIEGMAILF